MPKKGDSYTSNIFVSRFYFRARLEKEKKNELERNRRQSSPPRRQVRRSPIRTPGQSRDQRDRRRSPPRNNARSPPKITQNPQSARSRLGERPQSPIKTGQARNRSPRRSPPRGGGGGGGGRPPVKRNRSPIPKRSPQDRKPRLDQPRSKPSDNRPSDGKGSGWGASPTKPPTSTDGGGWGSSGGWGNNDSKNGGWGENVSWNASNGDNKNTSWGSESKSPKSWGDNPTSNDRNVTYTNDRTMIVSKPVENTSSSWGMRHDTGRKG